MGGESIGESATQNYQEIEPLRGTGCWGWGLRVLGLVMGLLAMAILAAAAFRTIAAIKSIQRYRPPGQLIDVGGYKLHLYCQGKGSPTVVVESGSGSWSLDWYLVQSEIAEFTRICTYDRAGYGWSDPGPKPRTGERIAEELHTLLVRGNEPGPYILVAHSLGGVYARSFASRYPDKVVGLVLVDALHPEYTSRLPAAYTEYKRTSDAIVRAVAWSTSRLGVPLLPPFVKRFPREVQQAYRAVALQLRHADAPFDEGAALDETLADLKDAPPLGDLPLIVLSHGIPSPAPPGPGLPAEVLHEAERLWQETQDELASLSSRGERIIAEGSGHYIQIDRPDLVIASVRRVVEAVRKE